jgi:hypothetical protein
LNQAQAQLVNGSQGVPSIAFINSATTGLYRAGTNILGISSAGVLKFTVAPTYVRSNDVHLFENGSASTPSITFASDTDTGLYRVGSGRIGVVSNGSLYSNFLSNESDIQQNRGHATASNDVYYHYALEIR